MKHLFGVIAVCMMFAAPLGAQQGMRGVGGGDESVGDPDEADCGKFSYECTGSSAMHKVPKVFLTGGVNDTNKRHDGCKRCVYASNGEDADGILCHDTCATGGGTLELAIVDAAMKGDVERVLTLAPLVPTRAFFSLERNAVLVTGCGGDVIASLSLTEPRLDMSSGFDVLSRPVRVSSQRTPTATLAVVVLKTVVSIFV